MVSVLIILSGILWVLFSQMDRNYEYPVYSENLLKEQSKIIQKVYQLQPATTEVIEEIAPVAPKIIPAQQPELAISKPITQLQVKQLEQSQPPAQKDQDNDVWSTFPSSDYESYYFLRNNPWSPDYKPGY